jgi:Mg/Co/Ni transporter MgtE
MHLLTPQIHIQSMKGQSVWRKKLQRRNGSKKRMQLLKQKQKSELLSTVSHRVARWRIVECVLAITNTTNPHSIDERAKRLAEEAAEKKRIELEKAAAEE